MMTIIAGIIMLGILVFVHELGHFCVAKLAGVKVLKFSLGFGPKLVSRQWGETEYMVCAIPLGGYVQMFGEGSGENGDVTDMPPEDRERSYAAKPPIKRLGIIAAGPLMNLALPFLVLPIAFMIGVNLPAFLDRQPCIGFVAQQSPASQAGFQEGDCIEAINGENVSSWDETNQRLISQAGTKLRITVQRTGQSRVLTIPADDSQLEFQSLGLFPEQEARIGGLAPGMPAAQAGMKEGDLIVEIDGYEIDSWYDLKMAIQQTNGQESTFVVQRSGEQLTFYIVPEKDDPEGDYLIGIAPAQEVVKKQFGPIEAVKAGFQRTLDLIELTVVFIQKLFSGHVSAKNIGGPITVVQIAGQAAQTDVSSILSVLAFLSIQLGILNLLPIPILDGGHIFFNLFELVFRRPLSVRTREIAQQIGLVLLIMLMVLAFYNDIVRIFMG